MEPEVEQEEEEECDWMCTQERMQELAREQERLQEERRLREQQRREEESEREAAEADEQHLFPGSYPGWDFDGYRRMQEWRQRQQQERYLSKGSTTIKKSLFIWALPK